MANMFDPSPEMLAEWDEWLAGEPEEIQELAKQYPPWQLFRMKSTNQRVRVIAYSSKDEGGPAVRVIVDARFNLVSFEREVFGIPIGDLEPCELPAKGEPVGEFLESRQEIDEYINLHKSDDEQKKNYFIQKKVERFYKKWRSRKDYVAS